MELQGTPPSDLTGKMTKWAVGAAGGPVIGVECSGLSRSGAERGWTFPATACVTSSRTTAVLPYCPTALRVAILDPRPLPLHCRSFAFALVATRSHLQPAHFAPPPSILLCSTCLQVQRMSASVVPPPRLRCPGGLTTRCSPSRSTRLPSFPSTT